MYSKNRIYWTSSGREGWGVKKGWRGAEDRRGDDSQSMEFDCLWKGICLQMDLDEG